MNNLLFNSFVLLLICIHIDLKHSWSLDEFSIDICIF